MIEHDFSMHHPPAHQQSSEPQQLQLFSSSPTSTVWWWIDFSSLLCLSVSYSTTSHRFWVLADQQGAGACATPVLISWQLIVPVDSLGEYRVL